MIRPRLEDWTIELVRELAENATDENDWFDFKEMLNEPEKTNRQSGLERLRKSVAAFANSSGGYLIFGVSDQLPRKLVGIKGTEFSRDFETKVKLGIEPSVDFAAPRAFPVADGASIYIVYIPKSQRGPHWVHVGEKSSATRVFLKRTAGGSNQEMSYEEVRASFQNHEERLGKLNILIGELREIREVAKTLEEALAGRPEHLSVTAAAFLNRYPTDVLQLLLADPSIFGLLGVDEALWKDLGKIRETVRRSNLVGDLLAQSLTQVVGKAVLLQTEVRDSAVAIIARCERVLPILESRISKVRPAENGE